MLHDPLDLHTPFEINVRCLLLHELKLFRMFEGKCCRKMLNRSDHRISVFNCSSNIKYFFHFFFLLIVFNKYYLIIIMKSPLRKFGWYLLNYLYIVFYRQWNKFANIQFEFHIFGEAYHSLTNPLYMLHLNTCIFKWGRIRTQLAILNVDKHLAPTGLSVKSLKH